MACYQGGDQSSFRKRQLKNRRSPTFIHERTTDIVEIRSQPVHKPPIAHRAMLRLKDTDVVRAHVFSAHGTHFFSARLGQTALKT